jgi:hypothetical protein
MIQRCDRLYQDLLRELEKCRNEGLPFIIETEHCFYIAERFRSLLRDEVSSSKFTSVEEEIEYFRNIKPKFITESEYASLLNFAGNFCPPDDHEQEKIQFWLRQVSRLEKFRNHQKEFYNYYSSNQTHLDCIQFVSWHPTGGKGFVDKTRNDYDLMAGRLIARERYAQYASAQLQGMKK